MWNNIDLRTRIYDFWLKGTDDGITNHTNQLITVQDTAWASPDSPRPSATPLCTAKRGKRIGMVKILIAVVVSCDQPHMENHSLEFYLYVISNLKFTKCVVGDNTDHG
jgi:hypothetical protein